MIDWTEKVRELRRIANEMELLSQQLEGRKRMLLGRSADELKLFAADIESLLDIEEAPLEHTEVPEWLWDETYFDEQDG